MDIVAVVPAGGMGTRIAPSPVSKEIFPLGFSVLDAQSAPRPKVALEHLFEKMTRAGIRKVYLVIGKGKWDIPAYTGDGSAFGLEIAYLVLRVPWGVPFTVNQAYPFVSNSLVAMGFADILFSPDDAFVQLMALCEETAADVVLGVVPAPRGRRVERLALGPAGRVQEFDIKSDQSRLEHSWTCSIWRPRFSDFLHTHLKGRLEAGASQLFAEERELCLGDVFQAASEGGLEICGKVLSSEPYLDIGTPEDLRTAIRLCTDSQTRPGNLTTQ